MGEVEQTGHKGNFLEKLSTKSNKTKVVTAMSILSLCLIVVAAVIVLPQVSKLKNLRTSLGGGSESSPEAVSGSNTPKGQSVIKSFFNSDGSVNTAKVDQVKSQIPSAYSGVIASRITPLINNAVTDGTITPGQATALKSAFGI